MALLTLQQRIFIVKNYYQSNKSTEIVQNDFPNIFRKCTSPTTDTILKLVACFEQFGTIRRRPESKNKVETKTQNDDPKSPGPSIMNVESDDESILDVKKESVCLELTENDIKSEIELCKEIEEEPRSREQPESEIGNSTSNSDDENTNFKCDQCNLIFKKDQYLKHLKVHEKVNCEVCEELVENYDKHMKQHDEKKIQCKECDSSFRCKSHLSMHMTVHSNARPFKCEHCDKKFKRKAYLSEHEKYHLGEKTQICSICEKAFINKSDLNKHIRTHSQEKNSMCSFCGKRFTTNDQMKVHIRIHTGDKPYKCHQCPKAFSTNSTLKIHFRVHSGEKPFSCQFCGKCFIDGGTKRVHERTHTKDYPYKCHLCFKAHNHPSNLKSHMRHAHRQEQGTSSKS